MGKATFDVDALQCQQATEVIEALIKEKHNEQTNSKNQSDISTNLE